MSCQHIYNDITFDYIQQEVEENFSLTRSHFLIFVYSEELWVEEGQQQVIVKSGECIFIKKIRSYP